MPRRRWVLPLVAAMVAAASSDAVLAQSAPQAAPTDAEVADHVGQWLRQPRAGAPDPREVDRLLADLDRPVALVVSGAVSLGSYQGGFLHAYVEYLIAARKLAEQVRKRTGRALPPSYQEAETALSVVAGASSGSIDAVVAALAACQSAVPDPTKSAFYQVWIPVGAEGKEGLVHGPDVGGDGMLSRKPVLDAIDRLNKNLDGNRLFSGCQIDVGLSETRLQSRRVGPFEHQRLTVARQMEQFMFTVRGNGQQFPAVRPFLVPEPDPKLLSSKLYPRVGGSDATASFADVTRLLQASSAFPLAFAPVRLGYRLGGAAECARYLDGGVFDNTPADLAVRMRRDQVVVRGDEGAGTRYLIEDPDLVEWDRPTKLDATTECPDAPDHDDHTLIGTWWPFVKNFVGSALDADLMSTIADSDSLDHGIEVPLRTRPVAGAYLAEFLAFFETDFRVFDFYAGMEDAWQYLTAHALGFRVMQRAASTPPIRSPEFECVHAWHASDAFVSGVDPPACGALLEPGRSNLLALLWTTEAARGDDPTDDAKFFAKLGRPWGKLGHRYRFQDLKDGHEVATAETAPRAIRRNMQDVIVRFGHNQGDATVELGVASVAKAAANYYAYQPPPAFLGVGLVTDGLVNLELATPTARAGLRLSGNLRVANLHEVVLDPGPGASSTLSLDYQGAVHLVEEVPLRRFLWQDQATLQVAFGLGYGVTWRRRDGWSPLMFRHGPEGLLEATFFQRLYIEASVVRYLDDCTFNNACAGADPSARAHLTPIATSSWDWHLTFGFRFFLE